MQQVFDNALLIQCENQIRKELGKLTFKDANEREKFLIIHELVVFENNAIHIALKGREFLKYLIQQGNRIAKPG